MKKLSSEIVKILATKLDKSEKTVKKDIYLLAKNYPICTKNALAQIYAMQYGKTVLKKLNKEDKASLPNIEVIKRKITIEQKTSKPKSKEKIIQFVKYDTNDPFRVAHIQEINRAYTFKCYTSAFILCRKVIENLLIDILRSKFPPTSKENKELYYDTARRRYKDFSDILDNLSKKSSDFEMERTLVEKIVKQALPFKKEANDKTHSWYHIVKKKKELDDIDIQISLDLIHTLENKVLESKK